MKKLLTDIEAVTLDDDVQAHDERGDADAEDELKNDTAASVFPGGDTGTARGDGLEVASDAEACRGHRRRSADHEFGGW